MEGIQGNGIIKSSVADHSHEKDWRPGISKALTTTQQSG